MVTECGMSEEIGPVFVDTNTESPDMRSRIDGEVSRILREAYSRVTTLLVRPILPERCRSFCLSKSQELKSEHMGQLLEAALQPVEPVA